MINKKAFIFDRLTEPLRFKIGADPRNTTYRLGSFSPDATIYTGEPDINYYSEIFIRETNQMWRCNQFWMNDVHREADNDLVTERAERIVGDELNRLQIENLEKKFDEQVQKVYITTEQEWETLLADQEAFLAFCESHKGWMVDIVENETPTPTDSSTFDPTTGKLSLAGVVSANGRLSLNATIDNNGKLTL